jgi:hypothetical protein
MQKDAAGSNADPPAVGTLQAARNESADGVNNTIATQTDAVPTPDFPDVIKFDDADFATSTSKAFPPVPAVAKESTAPQEGGKANVGKEEDEESDDEAPEAVSNVQAAAAAKETAQVAQKAAKE